MLVECDPAIKSIIVNINSENNEYIIEDLDDSHLVVQENKVQQLKYLLDQVRLVSSVLLIAFLTNIAQRLKDTFMEPERDSDSDRDVKD